MTAGFVQDFKIRLRYFEKLGLKDCVLPDGPPALSHPANEDLFAGTPIWRPLRGAYTGLGGTICVGPPVGRNHLPSGQRDS